MAIPQLDVALASVDAAMSDLIDSDVQVLYDASHHIVKSGGKRIRPRVAILAYLAAGGTDVTEVIPMATAVEIVHTATLVHDDINDHSVLRRGRPTVHSIWGRTFALLTGDYMFAKVYQLMSTYPPEQSAVMSDACVRLVEGETIQALAAKSGEMDRQTYKEVISRKTASLFEASARIGAMRAGADSDVIEALAAFGHDLGLTFQIIDDVLDIVGDPEQMGKPVGADIAQGRGVMAVQNGRRHVNGAGAVVAEANPVEKMLNDLRSSGAVEIARNQAYRVAERARQSLKDVPESPAREAMFELVDEILDRDH